ncbi:MAG: ribosome recycling factor [Patescibacteria group bacterium]
MYKQLIDKKKAEFEKALDHLYKDLAAVRTGRASAGLVEGILVESYGTTTPLKNIAGITVPEARTIVIQPWDKGILAAVEKAISAANIGVTPVNDGSHIRLNLPPLTEERRVEMVKLVKQHAESSRVRVRNIREEIWREVGKMLKDKKITEDQKYQAQEDLKKIVDSYNEQIKNLAEAKEKEVMTV